MAIQKQTYGSLAREAIRVLNTKKDKQALIKYINKLIKYANDSYFEYDIPVITPPNKIQHIDLERLKQGKDARNFGFRFTENCVISNKCNKGCYNYQICKADYIKRIELERIEQEEREKEEDYIKDESEIYEDD